MDNYIGKDIHNPKLKFWGVTRGRQILSKFAST